MKSFMLLILSILDVAYSDSGWQLASRDLDMTVLNNSILLRRSPPKRIPSGQGSPPSSPKQGSPGPGSPSGFRLSSLKAGTALTSPAQNGFLSPPRSPPPRSPSPQKQGSPVASKRGRSASPSEHSDKRQRPNTPLPTSGANPQRSPEKTNLLSILQAPGQRQTHGQSSNPPLLLQSKPIALALAQNHGASGGLMHAPAQGAHRPAAGSQDLSRFLPPMPNQAFHFKSPMQVQMETEARHDKPKPQDMQRMFHTWQSGFEAGTPLAPAADRQIETSMAQRRGVAQLPALAAPALNGGPPANNPAHHPPPNPTIRIQPGSYRIVNAQVHAAPVPAANANANAVPVPNAGLLAGVGAGANASPVSTRASFTDMRPSLSSPALPGSPLPAQAQAHAQRVGQIARPLSRQGSS